MKKAQRVEKTINLNMQKNLAGGAIFYILMLSYLISSQTKSTFEII